MMGNQGVRRDWEREFSQAMEEANRAKSNIDDHKFWVEKHPIIGRFEYVLWVRFVTEADFTDILNTLVSMKVDIDSFFITASPKEAEQYKGGPSAFSSTAEKVFTAGRAVLLLR